MSNLSRYGDSVTPWERLPEDTRKRLVDEEHTRMPMSERTPLLDGKGFWNDTSVPRAMDRSRAEARVKARINRGES